MSGFRYCFVVFRRLPGCSPPLIRSAHKHCVIVIRITGDMWRRIVLSAHYSWECPTLGLSLRLTCFPLNHRSSSAEKPDNSQSKNSLFFYSSNSRPVKELKSELKCPIQKEKSCAAPPTELPGNHVIPMTHRTLAFRHM